MSSSSPLLALKTTLELEADEVFTQVYVIKVPVKLANKILKLLRTISEPKKVDLQHLRRFARLDDLPLHLRFSLSGPSYDMTQSESAPADLYLLVGLVSSIERMELENCLSKALSEATSAHGFGVRTVTVPLLAPTSPEQARSWSSSYWPTIYKKSNPFGPHPSIVSRAEGEILEDLRVWMGMAVRVAKRSQSIGYGEPIGAVIVERGRSSYAVALAGDGRWRGYERNGVGNPMAHAVLRAIGMVAQKLKATEGKEHSYEDAFLDRPLVAEEQVIYDSGHVPAAAYLCHGLEIYITHEPCVACSMALLHSRFNRVVFACRMPRTGGLSSEICMSGAAGRQRGLGYGLFWRKELNWSMLAWQTKGVGLDVEDLDSTIQA